MGLSSPISPRLFRSLVRASAGCLASVAIAAAQAAAAAGTSVYLEDLTSPELAHRIAAGAITVLVPIGATEQTGPYVTLGKHNTRVRVLAGRIAGRLGNAVVAPVIAYVPEGSISPPEAHMRYAGTLSVSTATFEGILEGAARSLRQHGFRDIVFVGDHGGYQASEARVAQKLDREWSHDAARVHALGAYYDAIQHDYVADLRAHGLSSDEIGLHGGVADTSLSMALDPASVRGDALAHAAAPRPGDGLRGDPRRSSAALGELGVSRIVERSVAAIRAAQASH